MQHWNFTVAMSSAFCCGLTQYFHRYVVYSIQVVLYFVREPWQSAEIAGMDGLSRCCFQPAVFAVTQWLFPSSNTCASSCNKRFSNSPMGLFPNIAVYYVADGRLRVWQCRPPPPFPWPKK